MTTRDNHRAGKYENNISYSIPPMEPIDEATTTIAQAQKLKDAHTAAKLNQRRLWREAEANAVALFRADLEAEHNMTNHSKASTLWLLAWEYGHSSGYEQVITHYEDLLDLVDR